MGLNERARFYQQQLIDGQLQQTYEELVKYLHKLSHYLSKHYNDFKFGNVSPGYLDFTYFPLFNEYLRKYQLRFGIVLNHKQMRFELWLMGQNADIQQQFWQQLKTSRWNQSQTTMPKYSVLETVLVEQPDFESLDILSAQIGRVAFTQVEEIITHLKTLNPAER